MNSFEQAIKDISGQKFNRRLLVDVITEQYSKSNCHPDSYREPTANCQLLLKDDTYTVCTGHQLCLFTGPLYFIYKILSTINLAEELKKKYPAYNFVPVYWMASEDHDFEEVNHINIFGKKVEWKSEEIGSRQLAVGKLKTASLKSILYELKNLIGDSENANALLELFHNAYLNQPDLASATRYLVNELFGKYGLVIIDANDKHLKNEMKEIFSDEIENQTSFKLVSKIIQELEKQGYKAQVNPREINLFLLKENERIRIEKAAVQPETLNFKPETLSPNVVTRPLYQQKILPNVAYVGGPAEISYWLEYKTMFEHYKIFFPVLVPRNFVMLIDKNISDKLKKLGLDPEDVFLTESKMAEKYISSISGDKVSFNAEKEQLNKQYKSIEEKLALVDKSLTSAAGAELKKQLNALGVLEKKMFRSFKKKNETAVTQIEKLKQQLFPNNELQERYDNIIPYYLNHGRNIFDELKNNMNPLDFRFIILSE